MSAVSSCPVLQEGGARLRDRSALSAPSPPPPGLAELALHVPMATSDSHHQPIMPSLTDFCVHKDEPDIIQASGVSTEKGALAGLPAADRKQNHLAAGCGDNHGGGGIAYLGGVCSAKRKCVLAEDNGLNLAFTIAHELGHK
ncbi:hypothetical protein CRUP_012258 [Coryphaenoides rupestris]|nr:hypothetical protein CRUP_012258 [Coryphaenoides rupestris]